jgi:cytochrome c-type biogenesis protein
MLLMPLDVGLLASFGAGLLSFLSPCILPLVPAYLCFLAGISPESLTASATPGQTARVVARAAAFVAGFSCVFIALGASASAAGQLVSDHLTLLSRIAGAIIVVLGLHMTGLPRLNVLLREARLDMSARPAGLLGAFVIGLAFGFGWTPCVGPVLASILLLSGTSDTVGEGVTLLAAYAAGIGVPFLAAAAFSGPALRTLGRMKSLLPVIEKVMGLALIATGLLVFFGLMPVIGNWLLDTFPILGRIG